jgi:hypothetical protein
VNSGSSNNKIFANTISNSIVNAILVTSSASSNTFSTNKIVSSTPQGLKIEQDPTSNNDIFANNQLIHSSTQATIVAIYRNVKWLCGGLNLIT